MQTLEIALIGLALFAYTLVSKRVDKLPVTMPIAFVIAGAAASATNLIEVSADLSSVGLLAEVTLATILFSDATRISLPRLRRSAGLPIRLLAIGLPLTIVLGAVVNRLLFPDWPLAAAVLLAAVLAPTDAALGSAVIEDEAVPARERLTLNVESGLNDGLVVPVVTVAASMLIDERRSTGGWVLFVVQQVGLGTLVGVVVGLGGVVALRTARHADWSDGRFEQIATFALPIVALCGAISIDGNGFIAAFVAGLGFGSGWLNGKRGTHAGAAEAEHLSEFTEDAAQLLGVIAFFVFGNVFVGDALGQFGPRVILAAVAALTVVRMLPVAIALLGSGLNWRTTLFIGWFGPRGLASIAFGILLLEELGDESPNTELLFGVITLTVTMSVLLHGASAAAAARRYGAWAASTDDGERPDDGDVDDVPAMRTRWQRRP